jgi:hypothetical protein
MTLLGLAALCALALSAISASAASAGTTGFTCVEGGTAGPNRFSEEHCKTVDNTTPGKWGHVAISEKTTLSLKSLTSVVLASKIFGAFIELTATGVECVGCTAENKEVGGVMEVTGSGGTLTLLGVKVAGLEEKCEVVGTKAEDITTKPLKFTTTSSTGVTLEPVTGTLLAEAAINSKAGKSCPLAGFGNLKVTGKAFASINGATLTFNVTKASAELFFEGEKMSLRAELTTRAGKVESGVHNPVVLTPTTP